MLKDFSTLTTKEIHDHDHVLGKILDLFYNCEYSQVKQLLKSKSEEDALYALGACTFVAFGALETFQIQETVDGIKSAQQKADLQHSMCSKLSTGHFRTKLVYTECEFFLSLVLLLSDSIMGLFKAGLGLRRCYNTLNYLYSNRENLDTTSKSCVLLLFGGVNIGLSYLPQTLGKFISIFGYKSDRDLGFRMLHECRLMKESVSPISSLFLSAINLYPLSLDPKLSASKFHDVVKYMEPYPNSPMHLLVLAILLMTMGCSRESIQVCEYGKKKQEELKILCYLFDIVAALNCMILLQWEKASEYFSKINIFKAFTKYCEASCLQMMGKNAKDLYDLVPTLVSRKFSGRLLAIEAFAVAKSKSPYCFPCLELMLIFNLFSMMTQDNLLSVVEMLKNVKDSSVKNCIMGAVQLNMSNYAKASQFFEKVIQNDCEPWLKSLAHYHSAELLLYSMQFDGAKNHLKLCTKQNNHFEYRLLLRSHITMGVVENQHPIQSIPKMEQLFPREHKVWEIIK